jgi:hypothetical protein
MVRSSEAPSTASPSGEPPRDFAGAFAEGYVEGGGTLPEDFAKWAALFDLVNMA